MNRLTAIIIFFSALLLFSQSVWSGGTLHPNTGEVRPGSTNTQIEDDGNTTVDGLSPDGSLKYYDSSAEQKPMTAEDLDRLIIKNPGKAIKIANEVYANGDSSTSKNIFKKIYDSYATDKVHLTLKQLIDVKMGLTRD